MPSPTIVTLVGTVIGNVSEYVPALTKIVAGPVTTAQALAMLAKALFILVPEFVSKPSGVT